MKKIEIVIYKKLRRKPYVLLLKRRDGPWEQVTYNIKNRNEIYDKIKNELGLEPKDILIFKKLKNDNSFKIETRLDFEPNIATKNNERFIWISYFNAFDMVKDARSLRNFIHGYRSE